MLLVISAQVALCQLKDDFSDSDLRTSPAWSGTMQDFRVNDANELQLNASVAGESWLSAPFDTKPSDELQWQLLVGQSFAPSGSNFGRFYLLSDQQDLSEPLNGYYLQFGEAGSSDAVELFRQSGSNIVSVCRARNGGIATSFRIRVRVTYNPPDRWALLIDYSGGAEFVPEATGRHAHDIRGFYAGVLCKYTISNATRFYFDDFFVEAHAAPDNTPPEVDSVVVTGSRSLEVFFSEPLDIASVRSDGFEVAPHTGSPIAATLDSNGKTVALSFSNTFANALPSVLRVSGVTDVSGNAIVSREIPFLFFEKSPVAWKDIVISEIFADPTPSTGLPEAEFLELYNRSENPINLLGWHLSDLSTSVELPYYILLPKKHLVVTASSAAEQFASYGAVLPLMRFPSLNNAGDAITLFDDEGKVIDSVRYSLSWYGDEDKSGGGWSLELIDPDDVCNDETNWIVAEAPEGGTPGRRNSVHAARPDNTGPRVASVVCVDPTTLLISFDERLNDHLPLTSEFHLDGGLEVQEIAFADALHKKIVLTLVKPLQAGKEYTLMLGAVLDCPGNRVQPNNAHAKFLLPEKAGVNDVVINELLFNPRPTGTDFIEVYNQSSKVIDIRHWSLRNWLSASTDAVLLAADHLLIYPGQFLVFTNDADVLIGEYVMGKEETFYETRVPALNDDEGSIVLLDDGGLPIDTVYYAEQFHAQFLKDNEGVSLERISGAESGTARLNWRSASSTSGFATPGYVNSNTRTGGSLTYGTVRVTPEIIQQQVASNDFATINYRFLQGGLICNVSIVDYQGRIIRTIASNEVLGAEGFFRWDGDLDNGALAMTGYYMVWFEVFSMEGEVQTFRKRVAVY